MIVKIEKPRDTENSYNVTLQGFTEGALCAVRNALQNHQTSVGKDVLQVFNGGVLRYRVTSGDHNFLK
jgi:hypothetical protein